MKSFSTAYHISRKENKAEKETLIEQEHIKIVAAMKEMGLVSLYSDDRMIWAYNKETDEFVGMMKMIPHEYEEDIYFYADID